MKEPKPKKPRKGKKKMAQITITCRATGQASPNYLAGVEILCDNVSKGYTNSSGQLTFTCNTGSRVIKGNATNSWGSKSATYDITGDTSITHYHCARYRFTGVVYEYTTAQRTSYEALPGCKVILYQDISGWQELQAKYTDINGSYMFSPYNSNNDYKIVAYPGDGQTITWYHSAVCYDSSYSHTLVATEYNDYDVDAALFDLLPCSTSITHEAHDSETNNAIVGMYIGRYTLSGSSGGYTNSSGVVTNTFKTCGIIRAGYLGGYNNQVYATTDHPPLTNTANYIQGYQSQQYTYNCVDATGDDGMDFIMSQRKGIWISVMQADQNGNQFFITSNYTTDKFQILRTSDSAVIENGVDSVSGYYAYSAKSYFPYYSTDFTVRVNHNGTWYSSNTPSYSYDYNYPCDVIGYTIGIPYGA